MILRVKKEDSAYLYQVLESYEGIANYSTLPEAKGVAHRDIILHTAPDLESVVEELVRRLKEEIEIEIMPKDYTAVLDLPGGG